MKVAKVWITVQRPRAKKINFLFIRLLLLALVLVLLAWSIYPLKQRLQQKKEIHKLQRKLDVVKKENRALGVEIARLNSPEYIELLARKDFGLVKPGEEAYVVTSPQGEETQAKEPKTKEAKKRPALWQRIKKFFQRLR